jgi:hypothetical protein
MIAEPALTYYDFRYPNATNLLVAIESVEPVNTCDYFSILDTAYVYYEKSWGLGGFFSDCYGCNGLAQYMLDGAEYNSFTAKSTTRFDEGVFGPSEVLPSNPHTVGVCKGSTGSSERVMAVLAIVYGPQP